VRAVTAEGAVVLGAASAGLVLAAGAALPRPADRVRAIVGPPEPAARRSPRSRRLDRAARRLPRLARRWRRPAPVAGGAELAGGMVLAVAAGLTAPLALVAMAPTTSGALRAALDEVVRRWRTGAAFADALDVLDALDVRDVRDVLDRAGGHGGAGGLDGRDGPGGEGLAPLVRALRDHERDGTPLLAALEAAAATLRHERRRHAEAAARRAPVALLFPLVLCVLPAFVLLTVVPLLVTAMSSLRL
jgi:tight adherence protein B